MTDNPSIGAKADYVREALRDGRSGGHHCHWPGCEREVPPAAWGCREHWRQIPKHLQGKLWSAFRPGQEQSKTPSREYLAVTKEIQDWIRAQEPRQGTLL